MSFPRMTTRRWMIAVAVAGTAFAAARTVYQYNVCLGLAVTHASQELDARAEAQYKLREADYHNASAKTVPGRRGYDEMDRASILRLQAADLMREANTHAWLKTKYERAARHPWLPVPPDPPPPE